MCRVINFHVPWFKLTMFVRIRKKLALRAGYT